MSYHMHFVVHFSGRWGEENSDRIIRFVRLRRNINTKSMNQHFTIYIFSLSFRRRRLVVTGEGRNWYVVFETKSYEIWWSKVHSAENTITHGKTLFAVHENMIKQYHAAHIVYSCQLVLFSIVTPDSSCTILFNIIDSCCMNEQHNMFHGFGSAVGNIFSI